MAKIDISVSHELTAAEALRRIKKYIDSAKQQYGEKLTKLHESWQGSTGTFDIEGAGMSGTAKIMVNKEAVVVQSGKLPFLASLVKGKIEANLRRALTDLLA